MPNKIAPVSDLDLAALLCSKVCHDVIGSVGAITNGLEVLDDDQDEEMRDVAFDLIRKSAVQASSKLQFCRLAFGASGSSGAFLDLGDAETVARAYARHERTELDWLVPPEVRPKNEVKLLLNLVLLGLGGIPRGGTLKVEANGMNMRLAASGQGGRVPSNVAQYVAGEIEDELDARSVQVHYSFALARHLGLELSIRDSDEGMEILTVPRAVAAA